MIARTKKIYARKFCKCFQCQTGDPRLFQPTCGSQLFSPECLTPMQIRKRVTDKGWAARSEERKSVHKGAKREAAHVNRTPVKRCDTCADCAWRRPLDGCHTCGRPYYEEVIERTH